MSITFGSVIEDRVGETVYGHYVVIEIPLGQYLGHKVGLMSILGKGLASGYYNSLAELKSDIERNSSMNDTGFTVKDLIENHLLPNKSTWESFRKEISKIVNDEDLTIIGSLQLIYKLLNNVHVAEDDSDKLKVVINIINLWYKFPELITAKTAHEQIVYILNKECV